MNLFKSLALLSICSAILPTYAQNGCTDPEASNYNSNAKNNDGSCIYASTKKTPTLRGVLGTAIKESSGIVLIDGFIWTHNDSGNPPEIYRIDTSDGHLLQTVVIDNYPNNDWEDITADSNYIYIGDHGNNDGIRTNLKVLKIAKADITSASIVHVNAQAINFSYADQTSFVSSSTHNFDCEALASIKDSLYLFTKDRGDSKTRVYKMSKNPGTYVLSPYTTFNVVGLITGADYLPSKKELVLIGYQSSHSNSFLWYFNSFKSDSFFTGNKRRIEIGNGKDWQTEGVAWNGAGRVYISNESSGLPCSLYASDKNFKTVSIDNTNKSNDMKIFPNPASDKIQILNALKPAEYVVYNSIGGIVAKGQINENNNSISIQELYNGYYVLVLKYINGGMSYLKFEKN